MDIEKLMAGVAQLPYLEQIKGENIGNKVGFVLSPDEFQIVLDAMRSLKPLMAGGGDGWLPIEKLTKEHLPALIKGGTYDWDDSWNNEYVSCESIRLAFYMPEKWHNGAMRGERCEGHDNFYWHKPDWFYPIAAIGGPPLTQDERKDAWASLQMIGDAIEELFGPVASLESEESSLHRGPEYHHRAEGIVEALSRVALAASPSAPAAATGQETDKNDPSILYLD